MPPSIALLLFLRAALPPAGPSAEPVKEPALLRELVEREKRDQKVRFEFLEWMNRQQPQGADGTTRAANDPEAAERLLDVTRRMKEIDADNREWMKRVVAEHGWPGRSLVGANGARIAWLLVQHADADPEFQEHCLGLMEKMPAARSSGGTSRT